MKKGKLKMYASEAVDDVFNGVTGTSLVFCGPNVDTHPLAFTLQFLSEPIELPVPFSTVWLT